MKHKKVAPNIHVSLPLFSVMCIRDTSVDLMPAETGYRISAGRGCGITAKSGLRHRLVVGLEAVAFAPRGCWLIEGEYVWAIVFVLYGVLCWYLCECCVANGRVSRVYCFCKVSWLYVLVRDA